MQTRRPSLQFTDILQRVPWLGWAIWAAIVAIVLLRVHPRRYGAAFQFYMDFAVKLWTEQTVYDPATLGDVSYWPASLLLMVPLTVLDTNAAAAVMFALSAALLSYGAVALMRVLFDRRPEALWLAGFLLVVNAWPGWYHFKQSQLQVPMVAAMMLATAAIARGQSLRGALWLTFATIAKPIALVMALLAGALVPRMRLPLIAGLTAGVALPFAFLHADYVIEQYRLFGMKLWAVASAPPADWIYQSDFTTLLRALGIVLPGSVSFAIRVLAGLGTLWLAWQVQRTGHRKAFALGLLLLSCCYLGLFGPRNEHISYLVASPGITVLAFLILFRDSADWRGWLLLLAAQLLGAYIIVEIDIVIKPAIVTAIYAWVAFTMIKPERFCALADAGTAARPDP